MIFVFTGPDGSGRKTIADAIGQTFGMVKVLSYATRQPRSGEVNGQDYHFITHELFDQMDRQGEFLESISLANNRYGIRDKDVEEQFRQSGCIYLILNREGAEILKLMYGDHVIRLFVYADRQTVEERQRKSGMPDEIIAEHLNRYDEDMAYQSACEHSFENSDLSHTLFDITNTLEKYLKRDLVEKD